MVLALGFIAAACAKKDEALETDYNTKKATAQKLVDDVTAGMATMKADHAAIAAQLDSAAKTAKADTAKIAEFKKHEATHEEGIAALNAGIDSVKMYMNVTSDKPEFKNADERLGANTDDLSNKWKAMTEGHAAMKAEIAGFLAGTASGAKAEAADAAKDMKAEKSKAAIDKKVAVENEANKTSTIQADDKKSHAPAANPNAGGDAIKRAPKH